MGSHRLDRVASFIRTTVSDVLARHLNDPRIAPVTSVTRVEVSGDLMYARVFVSVMGTDAEKRNTMRGLDHAVLRVQSFVAKGLTMRHCPRLSFVLDESTQKAMETIRIIDESVAEDARRQGLSEPPVGETEADSHGGGE